MVIRPRLVVPATRVVRSDLICVFYGTVRLRLLYVHRRLREELNEGQ